MSITPVGWSIATEGHKSHLVWVEDVVVGTRGAVDATILRTACRAVTQGLGISNERSQPACVRCMQAAFRLAQRMS